jgi:FtsP/CotA-like multicopper oxidase with cupredoxin domain
MRRATFVSNLVALASVIAWASPVSAQANSGSVFVQCPGDSNGDAIPDGPPDQNVKCMHLTGGDGFITMADGRLMYIFGFADVTGQLPSQIMDVGALSANFPAPTIRLREGQQFYLNLTNVGMVMRPDLSDPHSVHFHGFPQAAPVFDGTPENSVAINMGSTFTYYYNIAEPGTYMYHCHVEATEHMQMGMLGNLYVEPRQNGTLIGGFRTFAYNDGDGSTGYDVEYPIQIGSLDPEFHDMSENVQPLPFALMEDRYAVLNGRGYPDTVNPAVLSTETDRGPKESQPVSSLITARAGQRVLLRISNLSVTRFYTLASTLTMKVVGHNARLHRGPTGADLYYKTNSVTLGGGESIDVLVDTAGLTPGSTYLLYTTNLNYLSNDAEDFGGMMTEIRIQ